MRTIEIDEAVYEELATHVRGFNESPNEVLKRLLVEFSSSRSGTPPHADGGTVNEPKPSESPSGEMAPEEAEQHIPQPVDSGDSETNLHDLIHSSAFRELNGPKRFLRLLKFLHDYSPETFEKLPYYRSGESRQVYISRSAEAINNGPDGGQPQKVPGTPFYVCTHLDNRNKRKLLGDILPGFGFLGQNVLSVFRMLPDSEYPQELVS